ncbi:DUF397 domain-containing protein [Streptomyces sp. NBC_01754]|uniref:DUF397 domain-containing protein n=1 Tax=Streptomyces sp. NBC_01754 TaxID=2975930 RepID=UPI002DDBF459|nr:DUF397 domain-containing protein [Streptomyces sp. NBC_01754]WSC95965.1 DUF397 domain-containing protein [Streptomyces sp. NBC_01754]
MTDLYGLPIEGAEFSKACGGSTHPDGEACVTLAKIGPDARAMGDSKRPDAEPLRFTMAGLDAAGIHPARFALSA